MRLDLLLMEPYQFVLLWGICVWLLAVCIIALREVWRDGRKESARRALLRRVLYYEHSPECLRQIGRSLRGNAPTSCTCEADRLNARHPSQ